MLSQNATLGRNIVDLRDELKKIIGRPVDLVPKSGLKWVIRDRILAETTILYAA